MKFFNPRVSGGDDEENQLNLKKLLPFLGIAGELLVLFLCYQLTSSIIACSYSTDDVLEAKLKDEVSSVDSGVFSDGEYYGGYTKEEFNALPPIKKTIAIMNSIENDDKVQMAVEKSGTLLSCSTSPYSRYMADSSYVAGEISTGYKVEYTINGEKLIVICTKRDATPVTCIKSSDFTEEEKEFFKSIDTCWEVELEDGSKSIQFW